MSESEGEREDDTPRANDPPPEATAPVAPHPLPPRGRLIGVDFGNVRIGLATCDTERRISSPLETYTRRSTEADAAYFRKLAAAESAVGFVVGLPYLASGDEGSKAKECRAFGAWLTAVTGLPLAFWDERFTTVAAEEALLGAGLTHKKRHARRDRVAAQFILQGYLDAGCPGG